MMKHIEKLRPQVRWIIALPLAIIVAWVVRDVVGWMFLLNNPEISASAYNSTKGFTVAITFVLAVTAIAPAHKKAVSMTAFALVMMCVAYLAGVSSAAERGLTLSDYLSLIIGAAGGIVPYWYTVQETEPLREDSAENAPF